jgi:DNA replication protein DnaC
MKQAYIPPEFQEITIETYQILQPCHQTMLGAAVTYLEQFPISETKNSFGLVAVKGAGELSWNEWSPYQKKEVLTQKNSYGIGKTTLTVAMAKQLIDQGVHVLMVSDEALMDELALARTEDTGHYRTMMEELLSCEVLLWDDLGKSKPSDFTRRMIYRIVNDRYQSRKPILFSSNESLGTLREKIGPASFSRLKGMCHTLLEVSGNDLR